MSDYRTDPQGTFDRARTGDNQAFLSLFECYEDRIRTNIRRKLRTLASARYDEDDVVQEIYKRVLKIRPKHLTVPESQASTEPQMVGSISDLNERHFKWLLAIAFHASIDLWRRNFHKDEPQVLQGVGGGGGTESACIDPQASDTSPTGHANRNEIKARIRRKLEKLNPRNKQLMELKLAGHSFKVISEKMRMTAAAVRKRYERLRKSLRFDEDLKQFMD